MSAVDRCGHLQRRMFYAGLGGAAAWAVGHHMARRDFMVSYLFAYTFWLGVALGCLALTMIHHLSGGRWGFVARRLLEAAFLCMPLLAALFIPLLLGLADLYPWARTAQVEASRILQHQRPYLNDAGFAVRAAVFLATWSLLAVLLRRWSRQQDETSDAAPARRMRALSGIGLVVYAFTVAFAGIDWIMSCEVGWSSTAFPIIMMGGQLLSATAFVVLALAAACRHEPFAEAVGEVHFHQLGNLLLTFVMFWTYVSFAQALIVYSGNLPHEIEWYLRRIAGGWRWLAVFLGVGLFLTPFILLLFRPMKNSARRLAVIAGVVLLGQAAAQYWMIMPAHPGRNLAAAWVGDLSAMTGLGGLWLAVWAGGMRRGGRLPRHDPRHPEEPGEADDE